MTRRKIWWTSAGCIWHIETTTHMRTSIFVTSDICVLHTFWYVIRLWFVSIFFDQNHNILRCCGLCQFWVIFNWLKPQRCGLSQFWVHPFFVFQTTILGHFVYPNLPLINSDSYITKKKELSLFSTIPAFPNWWDNGYGLVCIEINDQKITQSNPIY